MLLKGRISTPLEAGTSILDVHRLPSYLVPALEYTSKQLAAKGLHVTFVVARRDYQLPGYSTASESIVSADLENTVTALPTPPCSPASPDTACGPGLNKIRSPVRSQSQQTLRDTERQAEFARPRRSKTGGSLSKKSSLATLFDNSLGSPRLRWITAPNTGSFSPKTPKTPATPASAYLTPAPSSASSSATYNCLSAEQPGPAIRLIHTTPLAPRTHKVVATTLARASRRHNLTTTLVAHEASAYDLPAVVLHASILQNEALHTSEGLTLLSLDHLYTFKSALAHYAGTRRLQVAASHFALEDAVDELRRYVLSSTAGRRKLLKSTLVQAFEWLGAVDDTALAEVMVMYARAYGGGMDSGVVDDLLHISGVVPAVATWEEERDEVEAGEIGLAVSTPELPLRNAARLTRNDLGTVAEDTTSVSGAVPSLVGSESPVALKDEGSEGDKTPVPAKEISETPQAASPLAPPNLPQIPAPPLTPSQLPTPKITPRPLAPTLKLQTSFPTLRNPSNKGKKTAIPSAKYSLPNDDALSMPIFLCAVSPSPTTTNSLPISPVDSDPVSAQTDFEDAELTARSPHAAKTPGGSIWLGIDDILQSATTGGGGGERMHSWIGRRRRSSDVFLQTPAGEKMGPMTPNGYEDISPVTRGEWGFLMVGESFRTRTAGVTCV